MNVELAAKAVKDLLIKKAINDTLPLDMNELSEYEIEEAIKNSQEIEEQSDEVKRQLKIIRIENFIRNKNIELKKEVELEDYNLTMNFRDVPIVIVGVGYIINKNDDEFNFEEMNDDEIDEIHNLIDDIEADDFKTQKRIED